VSRIAVVHPTTLLGKELLERIAVRPQLAADLRFFSTDEEEIGSVLDATGEAAFVARAEEGVFDGVDLALFAGSPAADARAAGWLPNATLAVFASPESAPAGTLAAVAGFGAEARLGSSRLASAHPAAVGLAHLLGPLRARGLRRAHATAVLPVSTLGAAGIDALFEETRAVLTFSEPKRSRFFPAQIAFNLLPAEEREAHVEEQLAGALGSGLDLSVGLAVGGVFHGLALSVAVELDPRTGVEELRRALGGSPAVERARDAKRLGSAAAAGEENLLLGAVRALGGGRFRLWAVMDNLVRGGALNSLDLAEELLATGRPS
jgi:aspartate-semialdehyde dehydrogenase